MMMMYDELFIYFFKFILHTMLHINSSKLDENTKNSSFQR